MRIELKNVKHVAFASQETPCFEATVYIDGAKAGLVFNNGQGGPNAYRPHTLEDRLNAHASKLPLIQDPELKNSDGSPFTYAPDADTLINDALDDWEVRKQLEKALRSRVVFQGEDGAIYTLKRQSKAALDARLATPNLASRIKNCKVVLNTLPFDDALTIFRANG